MVSKKKIQAVKKLKEELVKWPAIGIIDMFKLPARQLHQIKQKLLDKAKIKMVKKRLIQRVLQQTKLSELSKLQDYIENEPALLFSSEDPFKLAKIIQESKSTAPAKPNDVATKEIVVPSGPTSLMPGPVIGELQRLKIPAAVEGGKINIKEDTVVAKPGDKISKELAAMLSKLGVEPIEIRLNLLGIWEKGFIYSKEILFIPTEKYVNDLKQAHLSAFNLSLNINYLMPENIQFLLAKAYQEAKNLASESNIISTETIKPLLQKAHAQANVLSGKINVKQQNNL